MKIYGSVSKFLLNNWAQIKVIKSFFKKLGTMITCDYRDRGFMVQDQLDDREKQKDSSHLSFFKRYKSFRR